MNATCANCSSLRHEKYCSACGQNDREFCRSLPPMLWDLLQEAFELDGRLVKSIKLLLFSPGALSAAFSANQRAAYISPIRLYLFTSLLFFFVVSATSDFDLKNFAADQAGETPVITISTPTKDNEPVITQSPTQDSVVRFKKWIDKKLHGDIDRILSEQSIPTDILRSTISALDEDQTLDQDPGVIFGFILDQLVRSLADPRGTITDFIDNVPIALFFLLPAYAMLLKLLYLRANKFYVEHFVFSLHLHAFAFIVFSINAAIPENESALTDTAESLLVLTFAVYYFLALRRYYQQGRRKTMLKYIVLVGMYGTFIAPAVMLVFVITVSVL